MSFAKQRGHSHAVSVDRLAVRTLDPDLGLVEEAVNRHAQFAAKGDSFPLHQEIVAGVVDRYKAFVEAAERCAIRYTSYSEDKDKDEDGGGRVDGTPIEIRFSRPIVNLPAFLDEMLSSREPFRLWGLHSATAVYGDCDAVDLHVGECIRLEAQHDWLRIHLFEGGCGNTVARLVSNLQHRVDGALEMVDEDLNSLLTLERLATTAA